MKTPAGVLVLYVTVGRATFICLRADWLYVAFWIWANFKDVVVFKVTVLVVVVVVGLAGVAAWLVVVWAAVVAWVFWVACVCGCSLAGLAVVVGAWSVVFAADVALFARSWLLAVAVTTALLLYSWTVGLPLVATSWTWSAVTKSADTVLADESVAVCSLVSEVSVVSSCWVKSLLVASCSAWALLAATTCGRTWSRKLSCCFVRSCWSWSSLCVISGLPLLTISALVLPPARIDAPIRSVVPTNVVAFLKSFKLRLNLYLCCSSKRSFLFFTMNLPLYYSPKL